MTAFDQPLLTLFTEKFFTRAIFSLSNKIIESFPVQIKEASHGFPDFTDFPYDLFRANLILETSVRPAQGVAMRCNSVVREGATRRPNLRRRSELSIR